MLVCTTWKARPLSPEQTDRMMRNWGKIEAAMAENPNLERLCWYINSDGSGGMTVIKASDPDTAATFGLETSLALNEFLEFDTKTVLDLDTAMPSIMKGIEYING